MKHAFVAALALIVLGTGSTLAADLPMKAAPMPVVVPYNWSGIYIGAHGGWGWAHLENTTTSANANFPTGVALAPNDSDGWIAGGQIGFNWQFSPNWLVGVEFDGSAANINGSESQPSGLVAGRIVTTSHDWDSFFTAAGRLGYVWNNVLLFAKGGAAWTRTSSSSSSVGPGATAACCTTGAETRLGWLIAGGIEYGFLPNWSAKVEFDYMDFGTLGVTTVNQVTGMINTRDSRSNVALLKGGINYRFNWMGLMPH